MIQPAHFFNLISNNGSACIELNKNELPVIADASYKPSKEQNQHIWNLFKKTLVDRFSEKRVDRVYTKYSISQDRPLRVKDVARFYLSLYQITTDDLKGKELNENEMKNLRPEPIDNKLLPEATANTYHPMTYELKKYLLLKDLEELLPGAWLERVTKTLSRMELDLHEIIPVKHNEKVEYYEVYAKIARKGLVAYALKPMDTASGLTPRLIFRPTACSFSDEDMIDNWFDNFNWDYGFRGYKAASPELKALMADENFCKADQKIDVSGYSLGGAHAQYFICDHPLRISTFTSYNASGPRNRDVRKFAEFVDKYDGETPLMTFYIYRPKGDLYQRFGGPHLGACVTKTKNLSIHIYRVSWEEDLSSAERHQKRIHDLPLGEKGPKPLKEFTNGKQDNRCQEILKDKPIDLFWAEQLRPLLGIIVSWALIIFRFLLQCIACITQTTIIREGHSYGPENVVEA